MAHEVFISYSNKDKAVADALCHRLEEDGIRCWIAPRDIAPGDNWAGSIASAIPESSVLVLIFSASANKSKQVVREVELAINSDVVLIPLRIEDVTPTGSMSYYLATTHWLDAIDAKLESKFAVISSRIKNLLGMEEKEESKKHDPASKEKAAQSERKRRPKPWRKKFATPKILALVLAAMAIIAAAIVLPRLFFNSTSAESSSGTTADPASTAGLFASMAVTIEDEALTPENLGLDPDMVIEVGDETLLKVLSEALGGIGENAADGITVKEMFQLKTIAASKLDEDGIDRSFIQENTGGCNIVHTQDHIKNLEALQYAANLKDLILIGYNGFTDSGFKPVWQLGNLEMLYLSDDMIRDISGVEGLGKLEILSLNRNQISDIDPIQGMNSLRYLDLSENNISDIDGLGKLTTLTCLSLSGNPVTNVSALSPLYALAELYLRGDDISDLSPLNELSGLERLYLDDDDINDIGELDHMEPSETITIGISVYNQTNKFLGILTDTMKAGCEANGWETILVDAGGDADTQIAQVESLLTSKVDGLLIVPIDSDALASSIEKVSGAGIPCVAVHTTVNTDKLDAFVGSDNVTVGEEIASWIADKLDGKGNVVILEGAYGSAQAERTRGIANVLAENPGLNQLAKSTAGWSRETAKTLMKSWLQKYGDEIDAVLAENDEMGLGAMEAILAQNLGKKILVTGIDGFSDEVLAAIKDGTYDCTYFQDADAQGRSGVDTMAKILAGEPYEKELWIPFQEVTISNVDHY